MRSMIAGFAILLVAGAVALPAAQPVKPAFDVVSIKPKAFRDEADLRGFASGMGMLRVFVLRHRRARAGGFDADR